MITGTREIRDAYRVESVARGYVRERFREPLGAMLHARQVAEIRSLIESRRPGDVLELAPGPARITRDIASAHSGRGVLVDASAQMLAEARRVLQAHSRWTCIQGDAFALPFRERFDLAFSFRLIRHFEKPERQAIYRQIGGCLKPGGLFVFDAVNRAVSAPLRAKASTEDYQHYDALLTADTLVQEVEDAGLKMLSLKGVQHYYPLLRRLQILVAPRSRPVARALMEITDRLPGGEPLEWIVVCARP